MRGREDIADQLSIAAEQHPEERDYWLNELSGDLTGSGFPYDPLPLETDKNFPGSCVECKLSGDIYTKLMKFANGSDVKLHMILTAGLVLLIHKYSYRGNNDIIVGTPIYKQPEDLEFVNTILPLRNRLQEGITFKELVLQVRETVMKAVQHYSYPMEILVEQLNMTYCGGNFPLFDIALLLENIHDIKYIEHINTDVLISFLHTGECIEEKIEYNPALYRQSTIERISGHFRCLLQEAFSNVDQPLAELSILSEEEKHRILYEFNNTQKQYRGTGSTGPTIHRWFEGQVEKIPGRIAAVVENTHVTYLELNRSANRFAFYLQEKGAVPGTVVGLMKGPSIEMIAGLLGILKAGAAYLPIDPTYPEKRILSILDDSHVTLLLTTGNVLARFAFSPITRLKPGNIEPTVTAPREPIQDLNRLPKPDRTLIDYKKYHRFIGIAMAKHTVSLQATRGCPFNCAYCHKIWPKKHVVRSAENIFDEIRRCRDAGVLRFVFIDDIFNLDQGNSRRLLESIIRHNMKLQLFFPNGLRGDILTPDFIDLMAEAGTVNIDLALESISPRIQKLIDKKLNLEKFQENVNYIIKKYPHIILEMELMLGFPTETEEEAQQTLDFLQSLEWIHFPNLNILKIYPNTDMYRLAVENGVSEKAIHDSVNLAYHELPGTLPYAKSFIRQAQTRFMNDYFLSEARLLKVLPLQVGTLTEDELIQKYNSYLPSEISCFDDIPELAGISPEELGNPAFLKEDSMAAPGFREDIKTAFPGKEKASDALRILLLDLSQFFSGESKGMLYDMVEDPLGLMYLLTYLNEQFQDRVWGRILKSRIDFDSYEELKDLVMDFKPGLIGIRSLSYYKEFFHRTVSMMRQWGIDVPIIAGGPYATSDYMTILRDYHIDLVVLGEGEITFAHLVETMMAHQKKLPTEEVLKGIRGIAFVPGKEKTRLKEINREIIFLDHLGDELSRLPVENPPHRSRSDDLLYVVTTSGSTGKPKGIMLEHRNMMNLLNYEFSGTWIDFGAHVLQYASIGFDVASQEIFSTFLAGGKLWLMDRDLKADMLRLFEFLESRDIRIAFLPPAFLKFVFTEPEYGNRFPSCVKNIIAAGEQLIVPIQLREHLKRNRVYLHNHYGPAETHVVTTLTLDPTAEVGERPAIGKPIFNTKIFLLDKEHNIQPIGVTGELYITGANVGRGYLNKPELTAQKFFYRSYRSYKSYVLYRTGDLARWLPDGNIEFLGRDDVQVQIRGFRVEPGEIESQLRGIDPIKDAVVIEKMTEGRESYLCAYVVSPKALELPELRDRLSGSLPDYMIPSYFVQIDKVPLNANGKVNRNALPEPGPTERQETYTAPANEIEEKLVDIWSQVLEIEKERISVTANFFQLGGHSLKATILVSKIHKIFNVKITLGEMFEKPFIRELAKYINAMVKEKFAPLEVTEKKEYYTLSSPQKRLYVLQQMDPETIGYNMPEAVLLEGSLDKNKMEDAFWALIQRHESLRTSFPIKEVDPVQKVNEPDEVEFEIEYYDLQVTGAGDRCRWNDEGIGGLAPLPIEPAARSSQHAEALIRSFIRPFDLSQAPLLRVGIVEIRKHQHILVIDMHHIISDGVSHQVFEQDFMALYAGEKLPSLRFQYRDYSEWQRSETQKRAVKNQESFWLKQFDGGIPALELSIDYPRPQEKSYDGSRYSFEIAPEQVQALNALALEEGATLFIVLLAVTDILLFKITGSEDIVTGTPVVGRRHADLERIIGMFINTLALRNYPASEKNFKEFLQEVRQRTLSAFENQDYPFEDLVGKVALGRDNSRNPLFDVVFTVQQRKRYPEEIREPEGAKLKLKPYGREFILSQFDLIFYVEEVEDEVLFTVLYSKKLFKPETIQRFTQYYKEIITALLENRDILLKDINVSYDLSDQKIAIPHTEFGF